jgi:hypothetical protein
MSNNNNKATKDRIQSIANHLDPENIKKDEALEKSEWKVQVFYELVPTCTYNSPPPLLH